MCFGAPLLTAHCSPLTAHRLPLTPSRHEPRRNPRPRGLAARSAASATAWWTTCSTGWSTCASGPPGSRFPIPCAPRSGSRSRAVPESAERVYEEFRTTVLPYPMGNVHPRFWAWVMGCGTPLGVLAELLAATMNPNMGGGEHAPNYVEAQVLDWLKEMLGYPKSAGGLLVSGGSMANLVALAVARQVHAGVDVRREGVRAAEGPAHRVQLARGSQLGAEGGRAPRPRHRRAPARAGGRRVPGGRGRRSPRCSGRTARRGAVPVCIVANLGTVNTGAIDDLAALADLATAERVWLHVDGAFGAAAALVPELRRRDPRDGAGRLDRLRSPQVALHAVRGGVRAGEGRRGAPAHLLGLSRLPGSARPAASRRGRPLVQRVRRAAVPRLPRAQGVDVAQGARRRPVRPARAAEHRPGALPRRAGRARLPTSS